MCIWLLQWENSFVINSYWLIHLQFDLMAEWRIATQMLTIPWKFHFFISLWRNSKLCDRGLSFDVTTCSFMLQTWDVHSTSLNLVKTNKIAILQRWMLFSFRRAHLESLLIKQHLEFSAPARANFRQQSIYLFRFQALFVNSMERNNRMIFRYKCFYQYQSETGNSSQRFALKQWILNFNSTSALRI